MPNNFYIKDNPNNITINYENYFFKIYFNQNSFKGKLIGLNLSDYSDIKLSNGSNFTVSISKGLRYILSDEEKRIKMPIYILKFKDIIVLLILVYLNL